MPAKGGDANGSLADISLKHALINASQHEGKASEGVVISKVISENPDFKKSMKDLVTAVKSSVKEVNSWDSERQKSEIAMLGIVIDKPPERKGNELPELPNAVQGKVVMRMAPYPSGPLHIGNTRMAILNDEYKKRYGGRLILCFDDTIGSKEKFVVSEAYDLIKDGLDWLGIRYDQVVYKSDRMEIFYRKAEEMIRKDLVYVCMCTSDVLRKNRADGVACPHRTHSVEENLKLWGAMLSGEFKEGQASVRLKTDANHPNPAFRDRVLLRISESVHPRVGSKYRVWPMLEFSWAVDDYELGMTHILRGKDLIMEDDMEVFVWEKMGVPKSRIPKFLHYGMLKLEEAKLSKSASRASIESGEFTGWDDPRTWSLQSLRKRGILPVAVRVFIVKMGMSLADVTVPAEILYSENRKLIDANAKRYFAVFNPVEIKLSKMPSGKESGIARVPAHPEFPALGERNIPYDSESVFVEKQDLEKYSGRKVGLMGLVTVKFGKDSSFISDVISMEDQKVHWVGKKNVKISVLMPDGEKRDALAEPSIALAKEGDVVQLVRTGFCRVGKAGKDGNDMVLYFAHK
jgi:glutamyl-tRNA synthetase